MSGVCTGQVVERDGALERVLSRLPRARAVGGGQEWMAPCPAHEDRHPSLSIRDGRDGRVLLFCHAGCTVEAITKALGLSVADLRPPGRGRPSPRPGGQQQHWPSAQDAIAELERRHGRCNASWTYHDRSGQPVGMIVRWDLPSGGKDLRPVSRREQGWTDRGMLRPRPLYGLPDLLSRTNERVYVTEGEKAADAARRLGLLATTSPHGCRSAAGADWTPLVGRDVIIFPDNDTPGEGYARDVTSILLGFQSPATVRIVHLPGLPPSGDFDDWLAARDAVENAALQEQIAALVEAAEPVRSVPARASEETHCGVTTSSRADEPVDTNPPALIAEPILQCMADIEPMEVRWLWPGRVALGRITVLVGRPGEGKSFLTTDMAARVTTGSVWPDGGSPPEGSVILICAEDDPADTIRPRLDAQQADVRRVHLLSMVRRTDPTGRRRETMFSLADLPTLEQALQAHRDCRLVVVDPIGSFLGAGTDSHRDSDVRAVLAPVAKLAEIYGPAVLVVAHRRKSAGQTADDLTMGSRAFTGIARAVWHLTRDPHNKTRRLLLPGKNNLAAEGQGLAFTIAGHPAMLLWESAPVAQTADEALREEYADPAAGSERREIAEWLENLLADGPKPADQIRAAAKEAGYEWRTVHRVKDDLGIEAHRAPTGRTWVWQFPGNALPETAETFKMTDDT